MTGSELSSGLIGALLGQVLMILYMALTRRKEFRALLVSILAECDYNLSILDEITQGSTNRRESFKRLASEYFKEIHAKVIKYSNDYMLLKMISWVMIDMELFNREVERNGERPSPQLDQVIRNANKGVRGSLEGLKDHIAEKYGIEEVD